MFSTTPPSASEWAENRAREISGTVVYRPGSYSAPVRLALPAGAQALENVTVSLSVVPANSPDEAR